MPNRREFDHIGGFNFRVEIEGVIADAPFASVEGLGATTEIITFRDGSDVIERKRPGRTSYPNIVLRRGFANRTELWEWRKKVIDGKVERKSGSVIIMGDDGETEIVRWNFFEGWPCNWQLYGLDGDRHDALIEEIEIAVEKVERG